MEEASAVPLPHTPLPTDQKELSQATQPQTRPQSLPKTKMGSRRDAEAAEDQYGSVYRISGPVVVAEGMLGAAMYELVCKDH